MTLKDSAVKWPDQIISPEEHSDCNCNQCGCVQGYNQALDELSQLEIDPEKIPVDRDIMAKELLRVFNLAIDEFQKGYIDAEQVCKVQINALIASKVTWLGKE